MLERLVLPIWLRLSLALPLLVLNLWVLRQLLLPLAPFPALFLTAALLAFLLSIPCQWLTRRGLPRPLSLLLVLGVSGSLLVGAILLVLPRLVNQLVELVAALPGWLAEGQVLLGALQQWAAARGWPTDFGDLTADLLGRSSQLASQFSQQLFVVLGTTFSLTLNTVIVLVLAVILSAAQILVFTLLGIPYGVLFAVAIGFTTLVPYAAALTILLVSALLALDNPRTGLEVLAAAISVGQVVDQVIQPRLMGSIVGLQPAWLLVCLPIGARVGSLMGLGQLLGLLLAVPVASCGKTFLEAWRQRSFPETGDLA